MIEFHGVSKTIMAGNAHRALFKHLDFWMDKGERVAVLGIKGSGKSMLLELICGASQVDSGWIERTSTVSWPIPTGPFLISTSSIATNLRFVARLYGVDPDKFVSEVCELAEIGSFVNYKLTDVPRFVKAQLSFAVGLWFDFDIYLFDEKVMSTPPAFKRRAKQILNRRIQGNGLLLATSLPAAAEEFCDTAFVIDGGRAEHYTDMKAALKHFNSLSKDMALVSADEGPDTEEEEDDTIII